MKAIVTILDDKDNVVEKDKVVFPTKSNTDYFESVGGKEMRVDAYEFCFFYSTVKPIKEEKNE